MGLIANSQRLIFLYFSFFNFLFSTVVPSSILILRKIEMNQKYSTGTHVSSIMPDQKPILPAADSPVDPYAFLYFRRNPDGSLTRLPMPLPDLPATPDPTSSSPVLSKDFSINQSTNTWLRLFLPRQALDSNSTTNKLPLIVYYHGGGFVSSYGAASTPFHNFCSTLAAAIPAVIAYDDSLEALHWIKNTNEEWFANYVDLSNCFLMGSSAGANMAYQVGLRTAAEVDELEPLKIKGLILHQPYFGGVQRTQSELRLVNDEALPLCVNDLMWELALPLGANRDHEYSNPTINGGSDIFYKIRELGWKLAMVGCDGDPLMDRQVEFVKMVEQKGVEVVSLFSEGGYHGVEIGDLSKAAQLVAFVQDYFLSSALAN